MESVNVVFATTAFLKEVEALDFSFTVEAEIDPVFDRPVANSLRPVPPYEKCNFNQQQNFSDYLDNRDAQLFAAYIDGWAAGYLALRRHWNGLALVEDISVDRVRRQQGCGSRLMDRARSWAGDKSLRGLMLETQSSNVAACLFYEHYGFRLGGIDRDLYRALNPQAAPTALSWYLWF